LVAGVRVSTKGCAQRAVESLESPAQGPHARWCYGRPRFGMAGSTLMIGLQRGALALLALTASPVRAQAGQQPSLALELASQAPAGFDRARLQQRVAVYLGAIVAIAWSDAAAGAPDRSADGREPRFVARLDWPRGTMTPLHGEVLDTAFSPARRYELDVSEAESWEELERLVALKLGSTLRAALAQRAPPIEPQPAIEPEPAVQPAGARSLQAEVELGAAVLTRDALETPRPGALVRGAVRMQRWAFGVAATLSFIGSAERAGISSDALESTWAASLRYEPWPAQSTPWMLQLGADLGLFVARVEASRAGRERASYVVSPLSSLSLLAGYRLLASGSAALLFGPALDLLWNRSEIRAGGVAVYDSGRVRPRLDLKLVLAF
jgi:hypothetical protein